MATTTRFQSLFDPGEPPQDFIDLAAGVAVRALSDYATPGKRPALFDFHVQGRVLRTGETEYWLQAYSRFSLEIDQTASWRNMWVGEPHPYSVMTFASNCLAGFLNHLDQDSVDFIDWVFEQISEDFCQGRANYFNDFRVWLELAMLETRILQKPMAEIRYFPMVDLLLEHLADRWDTIADHCEPGQLLDRAVEAYQEEKAILPA